MSEVRMFHIAENAIIGSFDVFGATLVGTNLVYDSLQGQKL